MLLSRNKKNNLYPHKPQFYYIKVGFKGSKLYRRVFVMKRPGGRVVSIPDFGSRSRIRIPLEVDSGLDFIELSPP